MVDRKEQVDNNSGHIDDNGKGLKEQRNELIDVKAKINQHREETIQICEDLKERNVEIQFEEVHNKVMIIETKKFYELVRILEVHYQCEQDGVRNDGKKYYNNYNNYEQRKYKHGGQGRNNHNYSRRSYQRNRFYFCNKNRNNRSCGRNLT
ncbi:hypothetical protein FQA39_LY17909 [Lamprigera yunnana]|nr:hypothetical protein FQA39_LY17909 [Lamprigera yunnana]